MIWKIVLVVYLANYVQTEKEAISEQRVVIHHVKSEHSGKSNGEGKKSEYHEEYAWSYPSYEFSYKVNDPKTHDIKGQHEKRHGGEVKGLYWLIEPNGYKRTVNYHADDDKGFNADVEYSGKKHEYESNNGNENDEGGQSDKTNNEEENNTNNEENINNQQGGNEQADSGEGGIENQNNQNSQNNGENGAAVAEVSNRNGNEEESQNNGNNMNGGENEENEVNGQNSENENNINNREESRQENIYYNRRRKRVNSNRNNNSENNNNVKNGENSRGGQKQNDQRTRNVEQNKKTEVPIKGKDSHKQATPASRNGKNKEKKNSVELKNNYHENNEQIIHYGRIKDSDASENVSGNNESNKNKKFEHRIRIYHPKSVTSKP